MEPKPLTMRESRVLNKLRAGQVVYCTKINLADSRAMEIAALLSGMDCIWADMEHVANDWSVIEKQALVAKAYGIDLIVRTPRGAYSDCIKPLELDAAGILIPHVMNLQEAKEIVYYTKFYPLGRRPIDGGNADGFYTNLDIKIYMQQANERRFNMLQIEDPEPLPDLEDIIALPGVDMVFFGPGDFSQGIGAPGEWDHPTIKETQRRIAELAVKHGKFAATAGDIGNLKGLIEMGYRFISIGADVVGLSEYYQNLFKGISGVEIALNQGIYSSQSST